MTIADTLNDTVRLNSFESFNARNLGVHEIASSFVPPDQFFELLRRQNSVIIGPRGSGKTTLLKMLQLPALDEWSHSRASEIRERIDFVSVFVPADVAWGKQIEALGSSLLSDTMRETLGVSAFAHHVLIALLDSIMELRKLWSAQPSRFPRLLGSLTREREAAFVEMVSPLWFVVPNIPSLLALKLALRQRLTRIFELAQNARVLGEKFLETVCIEERVLGVSPIQSLLIGIDAINGVTDNAHLRWAVLFDELEIAPETVRRVAVQCLRSSDQRLLFKLSLSPFNHELREFGDGASPMAAQDYHPILLTYSRKAASRPFAEALLKSMVGDSLADSDVPMAVLGPSLIAEDEDEGEISSRDLSVYRPGTRLQATFRHLAAKDPTFRKYLNERGLDVEALHLLPQDTRNSIVRKIAPVVVTREAFRRDERHGTSTIGVIRSRKNPDLYTGADALFAITEGNPRWFISILLPLVSIYRQADGARVPRGRQSMAVKEAVSRFRAFLKTVPSASANNSEDRGLLTFVDRVGRHFYEGVVQRPFEPEPPLSFIVDSNATKDVESTVEQALHTGAIIYVPDSEIAELLSSVRGKRFRLSYMLASHHRLPLRLGKARALSKIFGSQMQNDLFSPGEEGGRHGAED